MNIPPLKKIFARRKFHRLRVIMRGYNVLKANRQLGLIRKVKRELADTRLEQNAENASAYFWGAAKNESELATRQYVLLKQTGIPLHKALLYSIGSGNSAIVYPLPKAFRRVLVKNGFNVSHWRSSLAWAYTVCLMWCFGIVAIFKIFYTSIRSKTSSLFFPGTRYAFFTGLHPNNLPRPAADGRSHDTVSWYLNWPGSAKDITMIGHDVRGVAATYFQNKKIEYSEEPFPPVKGFLQWGRFLIWSAAAAISSGITMLTGKWWNAFLLSEAAKAAVVRFSSPHSLAADYLFENSDTVYRPLWTYEAEKKGSRIISYFYSIFEDFKLPSGYQPNSTYWQAMNWPLYLVWDDYQEALVKRNVNEYANTCIVGPVWLNSSPDPLPAIPGNSIAVFDMPPLRSSFHFGFSTLAELDYGNYVPVHFIQDIANCLKVYKGTIVHKRKRKSADNHLFKPYTRMLDELLTKDKLISINPDTSAIRIIESCVAVISMPFTSTAILGRELGKPSVYYDPTELIQKDDRGAHGIPIITGKMELTSWMEEIFKK